MGISDLLLGHPVQEVGRGGGGRGEGSAISHARSHFILLVTVRVYLTLPYLALLFPASLP